MIEPTETESPQTVAALAEAFISRREAREAGNADVAKAAPARRLWAGWTRRGPPGSSS